MGTNLSSKWRCLLTYLLQVWNKVNWLASSLTDASKSARLIGTLHVYLCCLWNAVGKLYTAVQIVHRRTTWKNISCVTLPIISQLSWLQSFNYPPAHAQITFLRSDIATVRGNSKTCWFFVKLSSSCEVERNISLVPMKTIWLF